MHDVFHGRLSAANRLTKGLRDRRRTLSVRGKVGRALRRRPYPATACSRAGSVAFHSVSTASTERV